MLRSGSFSSEIFVRFNIPNANIFQLIESKLQQGASIAVYRIFLADVQSELLS